MDAQITEYTVVSECGQYITVVCEAQGLKFETTLPRSKYAEQAKATAEHEPFLLVLCAHGCQNDIWASHSQP